MKNNKNAGRQLIKAALDAGFTVAVHYENDHLPAMTRKGSADSQNSERWKITNLEELWNEATACDEAFVYLYVDLMAQRLGHDPIGWAYLVHGNDPDETISDHSAKGWVNDWCNVTEYGQIDAVITAIDKEGEAS